MIVDTFMWNNEADILECRLDTMGDAVDWFVLVEADVDHQDHPKPYHTDTPGFRQRFARWLDKLIIVQATDLPHTVHEDDPWSREWAQRDWTWQGLARIPNLQLSDVILHGDVDEICRPEAIRRLRPRFKEFLAVGQRMHCFAVDWLHPETWGGTVAVTLETAMAIGHRRVSDGVVWHPGAWQVVRNQRNGLIEVNFEELGTGWQCNHVPNGGWHFSWLGGNAAAKAKLGSFCHPEIAHRTKVGLERDLFVSEGFHVDGTRQAPVDVDESWPAYIYERRCPASWWRRRVAPGFTEDWFPEESQEVLAKLVEVVAPLDGALVEIGAWEGRSTVTMANAAYPKTVLTCDTWRGSGHEVSAQLAAGRDVRAQWSANVAEYTKGNVVPFQQDWREFVPTLDRVALAFIDAEHSYGEVRDNLRALVPKMVEGGVICGDDAHCEPVMRAVREVLGDRVWLDATLWLWQMPGDCRERDAARLRASDARLAPDDTEWQSAVEAVMPMWERYVRTVSEPSHAASPNTCAYLWHLVKTLKPAIVADLGSGISSAVLRAGGADVHSFDTDEAWAVRTEQFLEGEGLTGGVYSWRGVTLARYDLIFHDLANGELREESMEAAAKALNPGGVIVFDDAQHEGHQAAMRAVAARLGLTLHPLDYRTTDAIGRWAMLGVKNDPHPLPPPADLSPLAEMFIDRCTTPSDIYEHLPTFVDMVVQLNAQHVIELGSRSGVSTVAWLHALERTGGRLTSVDLDPAPPIGHWPHWRHIRGDDMDPDIYGRLEAADIVFIDTSHHYKHTVAELDTYRSFVKPGGLIVLHDVELEWPEGANHADGPYPVRRAMREFVVETGYRWTVDPRCWGLGIIEVPA